MNLRQLDYFVHVAELGSFSKAARVLDIAQPALSRQVRLLETDLRETLLLRNGRGVTMTEAGKRLYDHAVGILQAVAQAKQDLGASRDEAVGRITVGLPPTIGRQLTLPLIDGFRQRMPRARLAVVEGLSSHIVEWITSGRVDAGLLYNPEALAGLEITPVLQEPLCLVQRRAPTECHTSECRTSVSLADLARLPLVMPERSHVFRRLLETQAAMAGQRLEIAWEVSSVGSIIDLVCAGYGHAVLTASAVAASGKSDQLRATPLADPPLMSVLCLGLSASKRPSPLVRQTCVLLTELAAALPHGGPHPGASASA